MARRPDGGYRQVPKSTGRSVTVAAMSSRLIGVVLWAPEEVQKLDDLEWDHGWRISAALKETRVGDRLAIYRTDEDRGVVAVFDLATTPFRAGALGYAAYGRPTELGEPILIEELSRDPLLGRVFGHRQGRFYLDRAPAAALSALLPETPWQESKDPVPGARDPDWEWRPMDRWWGIETDASDLIAAYEPAWRTLGFATPPLRERSPSTSLDRTDLKGEDRNGNGMIVEVKHFVAVRTLEQLDRYLTEARDGGGLWSGHLLALTAYTRTVVRAMEAGPDSALWICDRDRDGNPEPVHVAGRRPPEAR
jgi:hypothetical protein